MFYEVDSWRWTVGASQLGHSTTNDFLGCKISLDQNDHYVNRRKQAGACITKLYWYRRCTGGGSVAIVAASHNRGLQFESREQFTTYCNLEKTKIKEKEAGNCTSNKKCNLALFLMVKQFLSYVIKLIKFALYLLTEVHNLQVNYKALKVFS